MTQISLRGLHKSFGATQVVRDLNLEIADREFLVLLGPSGCGKTTTMRMVAGLEQATHGEIAFDGRRVNEVPTRQRDVAMVFQNYGLYPHMTVAENIAYPLKLRGVREPERQAAVLRAAERVELGPYLQRRPRELSGGQRQRVALARSIVRKPQVFLMDEPLSNLDAKLRVAMRAEIKLLHQRTRTTTVYVTHDQVEAMTLGDRIAVMKDGAVEQFGTPHEIYTAPATVFVAEFIGSPAINWLQAQRTPGGLSAQGQPLALTPEQSASLGPATGDCLVGLRPEALQFSDRGLPGRVHLIEPTGPETYVATDTALGRLTARVPGEVKLRVGDMVRLQWQPEAAHLFDASTQRRLA